MQTVTLVFHLYDGHSTIYYLSVVTIDLSGNLEKEIIAATIVLINRSTDESECLISMFDGLFLSPKADSILYYVCRSTFLFCDYCNLYLPTFRNGATLPAIPVHLVLISNTSDANKMM